MALAAPPDAGTMLQNTALSLPQLMRLVTALGFVIGMAFIIKGILELKVSTAAMICLIDLVSGV